MTLVSTSKSTASPRSIDWLLFLAMLPLIAFGLVTMYSFDKSTEAQCDLQDGITETISGAKICDTSSAPSNPYFSRQLIWLLISISVFFVGGLVDWRFLRRSDVLFGLFLCGCGLLLILFLLGTTRGIHGWLNFGAFSFQPVEPVKLILILVLAKYFSRRHIEIAHVRHIL